MPGGIPGVYDYTLPTPDPSEAAGLSWGNDMHANYNEDDAVSSAISADTLTTPLGQYRSMEPDEHGRAGSSNTAMWTIPAVGTGGSEASRKGKRRSSKSTFG